MAKNRWQPPYNPASRSEVQLWSERVRLPRKRQAVALIVLLAVPLLVISFLQGITWGWACLAGLSLIAVVVMDYFDPARSEARVWIKVEKAWPGAIRSGQPSGSGKASRIRAGMRKDYFGRSAVAPEAWYSRDGRWVSAGFTERPEWFRREEAAEAYRRRLGEELRNCDGGGA